MYKKRILNVNSIITNLIRLTLILTLAYATTSNRTLVQTVAVIALIVTFIPSILKKTLNIEVPAGFDIIYLMFIYGLLTLGELKGFYSGLWWWNILMNFTASIALGFVGLSIIHVLYKKNRITANPVFASIVIFSFAISIATLWELFEFTLDSLINSGLQKNLIDTMQDLAVSVLGALLVSIAGFFQIKKKSNVLVSNFLTGVLERNLNFLSPKIKPKNPRLKVLELIKKGESVKIEFKSTLRTNLHTNQSDKKIEHSTLKTVTAFLNTSGGNLLIGVDDNKQILGLENDNFQNEDKLALHLTNLIKNHIGNQFLPFIKFQIIQIENKKILLVICKESKKRVFLKTPNAEEFFVRNGPASIKLEGNALIDYISHKFQN
jgi:hypothetical protein